MGDGSPPIGFRLSVIDGELGTTFVGGDGVPLSSGWYSAVRAGHRTRGRPVEASARRAATESRQVGCLSYLGKVMQRDDLERCDMQLLSWGRPVGIRFVVCRDGRSLTARRLLLDCRCQAREHIFHRRRSDDGRRRVCPVSYTHLRAHETLMNL
eukprot:4635753-Prymnesium_polylepis.2